MDALLSLPPWLSGVAIVGGGVVLWAIGAITVTRLMPPTSLIEGNIVAGFKFSFLEPTMAIMLFYTLPVLWADYNALADQIGAEANALRVLDRAADGLPAPMGTAIKQAVQRYAGAVADSEWPAMARGEASPAAAAALQGVAAAFGDTDATEAADAVTLRLSQRVLAKVIQDRSERLSRAAAPGTSLTWVVTLVVVLASLSFAWFFGLPSLASKLVMGGLLAAAMLLIVFLIVVLRHPFDGSWGLTATPFLALAG